MNYYLIAPIGLKSPPLVYECEEECAKESICSIVVRGKSYLGVILQSLDKPSFECKIAHKITNCFLPHQILLASFIAQYYCVGLGESYGLFVPQESKSEESANKNLAELTFELKTLSREQNEALKFLLSHTNPLLFGDTGSGKTEIYIHLIAHTLAQAKNTLFLMPEIALTPQIESRLREVFGDAVGIWHSKVTPAQKRKLLLALHSGTIRIIAGARSALFLPIRELGLVIVDEEHDDAYKSQSTPYYNARDMALYLGSKTNIKVVLGSATPSVVSYYNAIKQDSVYRLRGRYFTSNKSIYIVSQNPQMTIETESTPIDEGLVAKIKEKLEHNEQAIVFIPTRAHYKMLVCSECGSGIECAFCSVNMSLHLDKNALICHYCHWSSPIPTLCPKCKSESLHSHRIGTAQVAQALQKALPNAKITLFDRDNITSHTKLKTILQKFNDGDIDVLVGTQMLSKGHDYHRVNLAIILGIDYVLKGSDYRCNERAISLLHQIAGRSGRKYDGEVYVQSANSIFLEQFLRDYEDFLHYELRNRPHLYPPYQRLATLTFSHKIESKALNAMQNVREILLKRGLGEVEIVGDSKALVERLYNKYRFILLLRSPSARALLELLHYLNAHTHQDLGRMYEIDIDPLNIV